VLAYSTHLGAQRETILTLADFPADTSINHIGIDAQRNVYVSGTTSAADYPQPREPLTATQHTVRLSRRCNDAKRLCLEIHPTGRVLILFYFLRVSSKAMAVDPAGHVYSAEAQFMRSRADFSFDEGIHLDKLSVDAPGCYSDHVCPDF